MNSYNGFEPKQRMKAFNWLKEQIANGKRQERPNYCEVCSQDQGILMYHSEDYSEPFGDHIGQFGLCYVCHMMIHCRRNKRSWNNYKKYIKTGLRHKPYYKNDWNRFRADILLEKKYEWEGQNPLLSEPNILDKIEKGEYLNYSLGNSGKI